MERKNNDHGRDDQRLEGHDIENVEDAKLLETQSSSRANGKAKFQDQKDGSDARRTGKAEKWSVH